MAQLLVQLHLHVEVAHRIGIILGRQQAACVSSKMQLQHIAERQPLLLLHLFHNLLNLCHEARVKLNPIAANLDQLPLLL
ncbi:hypothetical protein D3C84_876650 [compost metagenome]